MIRFFLECAIRAALIVGGTAAVLYASRLKVAAVKHRVWTGVLLLMLLLPLWTAWGPKAPLRFLPARVEKAVNAPVILGVAHPGSPATPGASQTAVPSSPRPILPIVETSRLGIYVLGAGALYARLAIGTIRRRRLLRQAWPVDGSLTSGTCAAPVTVGCFRPRAILPEGWQQWPRRQVDVVLAHEGEHVRRRDPLVQWLALLNRAIFWFHPAAWWLER